MPSAIPATQPSIARPTLQHRLLDIKQHVLTRWCRLADELHSVCQCTACSCQALPWSPAVICFTRRPTNASSRSRGSLRLSYSVSFFFFSCLGCLGPVAVDGLLSAAFVCLGAFLPMSWACGRGCLRAGLEMVSINMHEGRKRQMNSDRQCTCERAVQNEYWRDLRVGVLCWQYLIGLYRITMPCPQHAALLTRLQVVLL